MRYLVKVEYKLTRNLTVHAANEELAKKKALAILSSWSGPTSPTVISVHEQKGAE